MYSCGEEPLCIFGGGVNGALLALFAELENLVGDLIVILIISILFYQGMKRHHYGLDTMDFNDNVRKDFYYG